MNTEYRTIRYPNENGQPAAPVREPQAMQQNIRTGRSAAGKKYTPAHAAPKRRGVHRAQPPHANVLHGQAQTPHARPFNGQAQPHGQACLQKHAPVHGASGRKKQAARRRKRRIFRGAVVLMGTMLCVFVLSAFGKSNAEPGNGVGNPLGFPVCKPQDGPPYTIAIDAGHGGSDVGAEGIIDEKIMTETTIGYLEQWLEQDENYTPLRTHAPDTFAKPSERAEATNRACAALLLSVHGNSAPGYPEITGFECYPQPPGREHHEDASRMAHLIAEKFGAAGQRLRGESGVRYLYYEGDDTRGYEKKIVEESDSSMHADQTFGLLERAECPAVLIEQCFVTSSTDIANWAGEDGSARAARFYYEAICEFFGTQPIEAQ